jgi:hypothetical protein
MLMLLGTREDVYVASKVYYKVRIVNRTRHPRRDLTKCKLSAIRETKLVLPQSQL